MPGFGTRDPNSAANYYDSPDYLNNLPVNPLTMGTQTTQPAPVATGNASATIGGNNTNTNPLAQGSSAPPNFWDPASIKAYYAPGGAYSQGTGPQAYQGQQAAMNPPAPNIGSAMYGATNPTQGQQDFAAYAPLGGYNLPNGTNGQASGWASPNNTNPVPGLPAPSNFQNYQQNQKNFMPAQVGGQTIPFGNNAQSQNPLAQGGPQQQIQQVQGSPDQNNLLQQLSQLFGMSNQGGFNSWGNPGQGNPYAFQTGQQGNGLNPLLSMLFGGGLQGNTLGGQGFSQQNPLQGGGFNLQSLLSILNNMSQMQSQGAPGIGSYDGNFFGNFS